MATDHGTGLLSNRVRGVPIWDRTVSLSFHGDQIGYSSWRLSSNVNLPAQPPTLVPMPWKESLSKNYDNFIQNQNTTENDFELVAVALEYLVADDGGNAKPAWHFLVNTVTQSNIPKVAHIWIDAVEGRVLKIER